MIRWQHCAVCAALLSTLPGLSPPAGAQGTVVLWQSFGGGFGTAGGAHARLVGSAGQTLTGQAGLADARVAGGFLAGLPAVRTATVVVSLFPGWNLIANPVVTAGDSVSRLFPDANPPHAFGFINGAGYALAYRLENGAGYWAKFGSSPSVAAVTGTPVYRDTIPLFDGWNLIGGVSAPVDTGAVQTVPPDLLETQFFGYFGGLVPAAELLPGYGYWVKAAADGQLVLDAGSRRSPVVQDPEAEEPLARWNTITVTDAGGRAQTLYFTSLSETKVDPRRYELPPAGPVGVFDVRTSSGNMAEPLSPGAVEAQAFTITVRDAEYPLHIRWTRNGGDEGAYRLAAGVRSISLEGAEGSLQITEPGAAELTVSLAGVTIPETFALEQNYPNPFNPTTTIRFALPLPGHVTLRIHDILGREVRTLLDEPRAAGYASVVWNGTSDAGVPVSSGVYFYRLEVTGGEQPFVSHRRMLLVK